MKTVSPYKEYKPQIRGICVYFIKAKFFKDRRTG